jgi:hypothetical protein
MGSCFSRVDSDYEIVALNQKVSRLESDMQMRIEVIVKLTLDNGDANAQLAGALNREKYFFDELIRCKAQCDELKLENSRLHALTVQTKLESEQCKIKIDAAEKKVLEFHETFLNYSTIRDAEASDLRQKVANLMIGRLNAAR